MSGAGEGQAAAVTTPPSPARASSYPHPTARCQQDKQFSLSPTHLPPDLRSQELIHPQPLRNGHLPSVSRQRVVPLGVANPEQTWHCAGSSGPGWHVLFPFSLPIGRCEVVLGEFLKEIKKNPSSVKFAEMANILVIHCQTTGECVRPPPSPPPPQEHLSLFFLEGVLVGVVGPSGKDCISPPKS